MMSLVKYHFKAEKKSLIAGVLVLLIVSVLASFSFTKSKEAAAFVPFIQVVSILVVYGMMWLAIMFKTFKLFVGNMNSYNKQLLPLKNTAFIISPLFFWFVCMVGLSVLFFITVIVLNMFGNEFGSKLYDLILETGLTVFYLNLVNGLLDALGFILGVFVAIVIGKKTKMFVGVLSFSILLVIRGVIEVILVPHSASSVSYKVSESSFNFEISSFFQTNFNLLWNIPTNFVFMIVLFFTLRYLLNKNIDVK